MNKVVIRFRFYWFFSLFTFLISIIPLHVYFTSIGVKISFFSEILTYLSPLFLLLLICIYKTFKLTISEGGFKATCAPFGFEIPGVTLGNYNLEWDELIRIYSLLPSWCPFKIVVLTFSQEGKSRTLPLGSFLTNYRDGLVYLYKEKPDLFIGNDVLKLIENIINDDT